MSLVDRYWEWRRRRALGASLKAPEPRERARELALVADVVTEHRGNGRSPEERERAPGPAQSSPPQKRPRGASPMRRIGVVEQTGENGTGYSVVLAALDGSRHSRQVGQHAVTLARSLGSRLILLSFINAKLASHMGIYRSLALTDLEAESEAMTSRTRQLAEESSVECEVRYAREPDPSHSILAVAEGIGAYCIVIGAPGPSLVDRALDRAVGGVYGKVLRQADRPVLSIR